MNGVQSLVMSPGLFAVGPCIDHRVDLILDPTPVTIFRYFRRHLRPRFRRGVRLSTLSQLADNVALIPDIALN